MCNDWKVLFSFIQLQIKIGMLRSKNDQASHNAKYNLDFYEFPHFIAQKRQYYHLSSRHVFQIVPSRED